MKNRNKANIILIIVFILFILTTILKFITQNGTFLISPVLISPVLISPVLKMLAFTFEAALIGGIADWFAVTALFKKPLGFAWHTAIIPNSRDVIIEKISSMVGNELLSVESIKSRLCSYNLTDTILDKLTQLMDKAMLENMVMGFVENKANGLDTNKITNDINCFIKESLKKENISDEIRNMLDKAFVDGKHHEWLSKLMKKAVGIAAKATTRERIYKILKERERHNEGNTGAGSFFVKTLLKISRSSKYTNLFTMSELIQKELIETLVQINEPGHPVFRKMTENCENAFNRLDNDEVLVPVIQAWKNGILEKVDLVETIQRLLSSVIQSQIHGNEAAGWITEHLDRYKEDLKQDNEMREWIDNVLKTMLEKVIRNEHYLIGEIAKETLESFTNEKLNKFFEEKVGNDLQWIRINGSIVGTAAGLLIYLFTNLLYIPHVVPLIHGLFAVLFP